MNAIYEEFRLIVHIVWRRRWLALAVAWGVCVAGWLGLSLMPNHYQSRARVAVQMQSLLPSKIGMNEGDAQKQLDHIRQTLTSNENLIRIVRGSVLAREATSDAEAAALAAKLRKGISVVAQPDNLFEISAEVSMGGLSNAENARLAQQVVQKLVGLFVNGGGADDMAETSQTLQFLDAEIKRRESGLRDAETKRVTFEQKYLASLPGTGSIDQRIQATRTELSAIEPNLASAQSGLAALNAQMASTPATIAMPGLPGAGGGGRIAALEGQLADAQAKGWTDRHPDVLAINAQIARLRASGTGGAVVSSGGGMANPTFITLRSMQAEKQAAAAALASRSAQLQADLSRLTQIQISQPDIAAEQARLSQNYQTLKDQYDKLTADREDIRLRGDVVQHNGSGNFRVIDPPGKPRIPSSPNRPLLLFAVLILGAGAGAGTAFALSQIRTSYATAARLSRETGLIVLGSIPEVLTPASAAHCQRQQKWFVGAAGGLAGAFLLLMAIEFVERGLMA